MKAFEVFGGVFDLESFENFRWQFFWRSVAIFVLSILGFDVFLDGSGVQLDLENFFQELVTELFVAHFSFLLA